MTVSLSDKAEGLTPGHVQEGQQSVQISCRFVHDEAPPFRPNGHVGGRVNGITAQAPAGPDTAEGLTLALTRTDTAG